MTEDVFTALADPTRRRVLDLLAEHGHGTATTLAAELPVSRPAVIKHLAVLDRAGLVAAQRHGREVRYVVLLGAAGGDGGVDGPAGGGVGRAAGRDPRARRRLHTRSPRMITAKTARIDTPFTRTITMKAIQSASAILRTIGTQL